MTIGPPEVMLIMLTLMLLPTMGALAYGIFSGAFERDEDVKYMALADGPPSAEEPTSGPGAERRVAGRRGR